MCCSVLFLLNATVTICGVQNPCRLEDPICQLYIEYHRLSDERRGWPEEHRASRRAFYEEWLQRLQDAVEMYPNSDSNYVGWAKSESAALLNSLGRYREALAIRESLLNDRSDDDVRGRMFSLSQVAHAAYSAASVEKDADLVGRTCESWELYRRLQKRTDPNTITGYTQCAQLSSWVLGDHIASGESYLEAGRAIDQLSERDRADLTLGGDTRRAIALLNAGYEFARGGRFDRAVEAFRLSEQNPYGTASPAVYLGDTLRLVESEQADIVLPYVEGWIERHRDHPEVGNVMLSLADAYYGLAPEIHPGQIKWLRRFIEWGSVPERREKYGRSVHMAQGMLASQNYYLEDSSRMTEYRENFLKMKSSRKGVSNAGG